MPHSRWRRAALIPAAALGGARAAAKHTVTLKNIRFHPATLSINRGDTVTWLGTTGKPNTTSPSRTASNRARSPDGSYTVRFTRSGTFNYHCTIHVSEGMKGKIVVR